MSLTWVISFHKVYTVTIYFFSTRPLLSKKPFLGCTRRGAPFLPMSRLRPPAGSLILSLHNLKRVPPVQPLRKHRPPAQVSCTGSDAFYVGQQTLEDWSARTGGGSGGRFNWANSISNGGWAALHDSCLHNEQIITLKPFLTQLYIFDRIKHHIFFPAGSQVHFWWDIPPISGTSLSQPSPASP